MQFSNYYYRSIYFILLLFVMVLFPFFSFFIFLFFEPKADYQLFFEAKFLSCFVIFIFCLAFSRLLNNLRHEKGPRRVVHFLWITSLSMALFFISFIGYSIARNYFIAFEDDLPVQKEEKISKIVPIKKTFLGPIDNSIYGQVPFNSVDRSERYAIKLVGKQNQIYQTSYFVSKSDFNKTLEDIKKHTGERVIVSLLPNSQRIISIKSLDNPYPVYENESLLNLKD